MKKVIVIKKILVCILILLLILITSGCSGDTVEKNSDDDSVINEIEDPQDEEKSNVSNEPQDNESSNESDDSTTEEYNSTLNIKVDIQNPDGRHEKYLVFLLPTGSKNIKKGYKGATKGGYIGPFITDENDEISIDISDKLKYERIVESEKNKQPGSFEVFITTEEDYFILNPLNEITIIEVEEVDENIYGVKEKTYAVPIVDKYPDGVVSLSFPEATFFIKLQFAEEVKPKTSYIVGISKAENPRIVKSLLSRKFQYWDTPFFVEDELNNWSGRIVVYGENYNDEISYAEYPIDVTFTNGRCEQGDIIVVTVTE